MRNLNAISPLLGSLLLAGLALAQEPIPVVPEAPQPQNIAANGQSIVAIGEDSGRNEVISQVGRYPQLHRAIRPSRVQAYPSAFARTPPPFSPLGALIGFGVGAAIGASGSDHSGMTQGGRVIIGGAIFAVIGGAIGGALPHVRRRYQSRGPDDDDYESKLRSGASGDQPKRPATKPVLSGQAPGEESTAAGTSQKSTAQ